VPLAVESQLLRPIRKKVLVSDQIVYFSHCVRKLSVLVHNYQMTPIFLRELIHLAPAALLIEVVSVASRGHYKDLRVAFAGRRE
jgi:hypothetical protein